MPSDLSYIFAVFILIVFVQLYIVYEISKYPMSSHKSKRKWTNIVLLMPLFGMLAYFLFGKKEFKGLEEGN